MVTSGVYTLNWNRNTIIKEALSKIGVASSFRNPSSEEYDVGIKNLNMLIKHWQKKGLRPTQLTQVTVFLEKNAQQYVLGPNGAHSAYSYKQTTLAADALDGATSIIVESATGFVIGYNIGIELNDGTLHWTTITNIVGTTITINAAITDDSDEGNTVFVYQSRIQKPLKIQNIQRLQINGNESIVSIVNREEYFQISDKTIVGYITQAHYSPKIDDGILYVFPTAADTTDVLRMTVEYPLQVFTSPNETPDFPDEWALALIFNLAVMMAPDFGFYGAELDVLIKMAASLEEDIIATDIEDDSIWFNPNADGDIGYS